MSPARFREVNARWRDLPVFAIWVALSIGMTAFDSYNRPTEEMAAAFKRDRSLAGLAYGAHALISQECLQGAGFQSSIAENMSERSSDIDFVQSISNKDQYEAKNHFDRPRGWSHREAFHQGLGYFQHNFAEALNSFRLNDFEHAAKILPRALHAEEDFFAHSNFVDLPVDAQKTLAACFVTSARCLTSVPGDDVDRALALLHITGFDATLGDELSYNPPGDAYPHGRNGAYGFAKDSAHHNREAELQLPGNPPATKYEAAWRAAAKTCVASMQAFLRQCAVLDPLDLEDHGPPLPTDTCTARWVAFQRAAIQENPDVAGAKREAARGDVQPTLPLPNAKPQEDKPSVIAAHCADTSTRDKSKRSACLAWCGAQMPLLHQMCARDCAGPNCAQECNLKCAPVGCRDWCQNAVH